MKNLSDLINEVEKLIIEQNIKSVSFDIDGTVYPMKKMHQRWWRAFFLSPFKALKFLSIKKRWEQRRSGQGKPAQASDVLFFEAFLISLMDPGLVLPEVRSFIDRLRSLGIAVIFFTDHGVEKCRYLGLAGLGPVFNCLAEAGELKPHQKIADLFLRKFPVDTATHLHLGDRWTDEVQAKLISCQFKFFAP